MFGMALNQSTIRASGPSTWTIGQIRTNYIGLMPGEVLKYGISIRAVHLIVPRLVFKQVNSPQDVTLKAQCLSASQLQKLLCRRWGLNEPKFLCYFHNCDRDMHAKVQLNNFQLIQLKQHVANQGNFLFIFISSSCFADAFYDSSGRSRCFQSGFDGLQTRLQPLLKQFGVR